MRYWCRACGGGGFRERTHERCITCQGRGWIWKPTSTPDRRPDPHDVAQELHGPFRTLRW